MDKPSDFRATLIDDLKLIASAQRLDEFQRSHPYIDASEEAVSSIVDYYTDELLSFDGFTKHFASHEIVSIADAVARIRQVVSDDREDCWEEIRATACRLLAALKEETPER